LVLAVAGKTERSAPSRASVQAIATSPHNLIQEFFVMQLD